MSSFSGEKTTKWQFLCEAAHLWPPTVVTFLPFQQAICLIHCSFLNNTQLYSVSITVDRAKCDQARQISQTMVSHWEKLNGLPEKSGFLFSGNSSLLCCRAVTELHSILLDRSASFLDPFWQPVCPGRTDSVQAKIWHLTSVRLICPSYNVDEDDPC